MADKLIQGASFGPPVAAVVANYGRSGSTGGKEARFCFREREDREGSNGLGTLHSFKRKRERFLFFSHKQGMTRRKTEGVFLAGLTCARK